MTGYKKGSISVYLLLFLSVFILLVNAVFMSLRYQGARVVVKTAAQQSLFDLFSRYEPTLLEKYDLLFLDGGFGGEDLKAGSMLSCIEDNAGVCWGEQSIASNPFGLSTKKASLTAYTLATDQKGEALYRQAILSEKEGLAGTALSLLKEEITDGKANEEKGASEGDVDEACDDYKKAVESAEEGDYEEAGLTTEGSGEEAQETSGASAVRIEKNPIEVIKKLKKKGILALVLPQGKKVSEKSISKKDLPSGRSLHKGLGLTAAADSHTGTDHLYFAAYLGEHLSSFTDPDENAGLSYQTEYIIGGKTKDEENLKKTVNRLLLLREGANLSYLRKDPVKSAEIKSMAAAIATGLAVPVGEPVVETALRVCYAYGESLLDVRRLLAGGKVPLSKEAGDWQLSLEQLADISKLLSQADGGKGSGLSYTGYLKILLGIKGDAACLSGGMDMIELGMRGEEDEKNFRLDNCIYSMEIELTAGVTGLSDISAGAYRSYEN